MVRLSRLIPLALALALVVPASASAAVVREYQLQFAPVAQTGASLAIVSALVDPQEALPASVSVPVPAGSTLLWAGEVLGGDPSADPSRTTTVERIGEMDVYTLTLEQAYTAQLEIQLPAPTISGSKVIAGLTWTNPGRETLVTGSVVVEPGGRDVKTTPAASGETRTNDAGETLYPVEGKRLAEGETYELTVEWERGGGVATDNETSTLPLLLGALAAAVVALVAVMARERTRRRRASLAEEE